MLHIRDTQLDTLMTYIRNRSYHDIDGRNLGDPAHDVDDVMRLLRRKNRPRLNSNCTPTISTQINRDVNARIVMTTVASPWATSIDVTNHQPPMPDGHDSDESNGVAATASNGSELQRSR